MQIGGIEFDNAVVLAPMAGVTDSAFRLLVKQMGCGLVYTEMISDKGLLYKNSHTLDLLQIDDFERPVSVQIFGSEPDSMAQAAKIVEEAGADIIDINMGCPTPKIVRNGEGAALMRTPKLAYDIMAKVAATVTVPVTVKIRTGWDSASINAVEIAKLAQEAGISAVAIHGRTREQYYAGAANWDIIKEVKANINIPVIGNGDVRAPQDAQNMLEQTGCDGIMIGRAAQGNPWVFKRVVHFLRSGELLPLPSMQERVEMLLRHMDALVELKGEYIGIREMRRHAAWYTKGLPHSAELRLKFNQAVCKADFQTIITALA